MYAMGDFFMECVPQKIEGDGWTALARFSRRDDYRKRDFVPKAVFATAIEVETRRQVESAVANWARRYVATSAEQIAIAIELERDHPVGERTRR